MPMSALRRAIANTPTSGFASQWSTPGGGTDRRGVHIPALRDQHIDELAVLVDGPVDIAPIAVHFDIGLVNGRAITDHWVEVSAFRAGSSCGRVSTGRWFDRALRCGWPRIGGRGRREQGIAVFAFDGLENDVDVDREDPSYAADRARDERVQIVG